MWWLAWRAAGRSGASSPQRSRGGPAVLADGRSPAPRVVGDLLIALRKAGATVISAPTCAGCGKDLAAMQRRGQDWYCRACGPRRERCAVLRQHPAGDLPRPGRAAAVSPRARRMTGETPPP